MEFLACRRVGEKAGSCYLERRIVCLLRSISELGVNFVMSLDIGHLMGIETRCWYDVASWVEDLNGGCGLVIPSIAIEAL